jgi:hypothetical protein
MPIQTKDINTIAAKFVARAGVAAGDYTKGVQNPRVPQADAAAAAAPAWAAGIQTAITNNSFQKGVQKAGNAKWQAAAVGKGAQRYPGGVAAASPAYVAGFTPFLQVIQGLSLPPRFPRGDARNNDRGLMVQQALNKARLAGA